MEQKPIIKQRSIEKILDKKTFLLLRQKGIENTHKNNRAFLSLAGTIQRSDRAVLLALLPRRPRLPSFPVTL